MLSGPPASLAASIRAVAALFESPAMRPPAQNLFDLSRIHHSVQPVARNQHQRAHLQGHRIVVDGQRGAGSTAMVSTCRMGDSGAVLVQPERPADFVDHGLVVGDGAEAAVVQQVGAAVSTLAMERPSSVSSATTRVVPMPSSLASFRAASSTRGWPPPQPSAVPGNPAAGPPAHLHHRIHGQLRRPLAGSGSAIPSASTYSPSSGLIRQ